MNHAHLFACFLPPPEKARAEESPQSLLFLTSLHTPPLTATPRLHTHLRILYMPLTMATHTHAFASFCLHPYIYSHMHISHIAYTHICLYVIPHTHTYILYITHTHTHHHTHTHILYTHGKEEARRMMKEEKEEMK